tara:strand:+ start:106 stop:945 length:840 start_codon:yes stop_codon:yes gene_type:complete
MIENSVTDSLVDDWREDDATIFEEPKEVADVKGTYLSESYIADIRTKHPWVDRAFNYPLNRTSEGSTVKTAVEYDPNLGWIVFPTIRESMETGKLVSLDLRDAQKMAIEKGDYITVPDLDSGNELSMGLSKSIEREASKIDVSQNRDNTTGNVTDETVPEGIAEAGRAVREIQQADFNEDFANQRLRTDFENVGSDIMKSRFNTGNAVGKHVQDALNEISAVKMLQNIQDLMNMRSETRSSIESGQEAGLYKTLEEHVKSLSDTPQGLIQSDEPKKEFY